MSRTATQLWPKLWTSQVNTFSSQCVSNQPPGLGLLQTAGVPQEAYVKPSTGQWEYLSCISSQELQINHILHCSHSKSCGCKPWDNRTVLEIFWTRWLEQPGHAWGQQWRDDHSWVWGSLQLVVPETSAKISMFTCYCKVMSSTDSEREHCLLVCGFDSKIGLYMYHTGMHCLYETGSMLQLMQLLRTSFQMVDKFLI